MNGKALYRWKITRSEFVDIDSRYSGEPELFKMK